MEKKITLPFYDETISELHCGDLLLLSGVIYTARDAAHKRLYEALKRGEELPFDVKNQVIYYLGPTPARPGSIIGSAGPTTSGRMDKYTPLLLEHGLRGMIGKGKRSEEVISKIIEERAVYMAATGGAGALLSKRIILSEIIAYEDLGTEAIRRLKVKDFPVVVAADSYGNTIYRE